jgi:hypothetical protein
MAHPILIPAPGLRVRKPDGTLLAPEGEVVEMNSYWLRRLADGDVAPASSPDQAPNAGGTPALHVPRKPKE